MGTLQLLASRNFIAVNKTLMINLGIEESIIIGELASEYDYWVNQGQLDDDGFFYSTVENVEENTTLTKYKQKKALDNLQKIGIIEVKRKGIPAKRYIKINENNLLKILSNKKSKNLTTGSQKILPQEVKDFDLNNNNNNNNNNKQERKKERKVTTLPDVTKNKKDKPTFDELIDNYTNNNDLRAELKEHLKTRKAKKATLTNRAIELSLNKLDSLTANDTEKILIVQKAIESGWTTFYPLKPDEKPQKKASYNLNEYEELTQDEIIAKLYG